MPKLRIVSIKVQPYDGDMAPAETVWVGDGGNVGRLGATPNDAVGNALGLDGVVVAEAVTDADTVFGKPAGIREY